MKSIKMLGKRYGCMTVIEKKGSKVISQCNCGNIVEQWYTATYRDQKHCPVCKPKGLTWTQHTRKRRYNLTREEVVKLPEPETVGSTYVNGQWVRYGKRIKFAGLALTLIEWAQVCGVSKQRIQQRLRRGVYDALKKYEDRILAYIADPSIVPGVRPVPDNWEGLSAVRSDEETCA